MMLRKKQETPGDDPSLSALEEVKEFKTVLDLPRGARREKEPSRLWSRHGANRQGEQLCITPFD